MPRRALHWLVLCFATLWFGVLVPVHNRGEISLPGATAHCAAERDAAALPHCHAERHGTDPSDRAPDEAPRPAGACAVCYFIAGLDAPPPVTWVETRLGLVGTLRPVAPDELPTARASLPFHSRAPPAA